MDTLVGLMTRAIQLKDQAFAIPVFGPAIKGITFLTGSSGAACCDSAAACGVAGATKGTGCCDPDGAIGPLNEAADLAPDSPTPLILLCKVYEAKKDFEE